MKAMVLAAGFGTRLQPITRFHPKPLLPIGGRPLLEWTLGWLAVQGVGEVVVNAHHLAPEMERWWRGAFHPAEDPANGPPAEPMAGPTAGPVAGPTAGRAAGHAARYAAAAARPRRDGLPAVRLLIEPEILGTGGGIANAAPWLDSDPVLIVNGDQLFCPPLGPAVEAHRRGAYAATLLCARDPLLAQVRLEGDRVVEIAPRPVYGDPALRAFSGVYLLSAEAVAGIRAASEVGPEPGPRRIGFAEVMPHLRRWLAEGRLGGIAFDATPFREVGTPEAFLDLVREGREARGAGLVALLGPHGPRGTDGGLLPAEPGVEAEPPAGVEESVILTGAAVEPGAIVRRSLLGSGAVARGRVERVAAAGGEERPLRLFAREEEEELRAFLASAWPERPVGERLGLRLLRGDGSARRIARVFTERETRILVLPPPAEEAGSSPYPRRTRPGSPTEADAFAYVNGYLDALGVRVPRLHAFDQPTGRVLLEDLGETHLYDVAQRARRSGDPAEAAEVERRYEEAVDLLALLQSRGPVPFDPLRTHNPEYDEAFILRYEARYFLREMAAGACGLVVAEERALLEECRRAARRALDGAPRVVMHRDFQSRNLMVTPSGLAVIDYQGARFGPPEYDVASLLFDPYVDLPEGTRARLLERYRQATRGGEADGAPSPGRLQACVVNRLQQALGAFGYLGGRLGKPGFLEFAPVAARSLREAAAAEYPRLAELARRVEEALATKEKRDAEGARKE